MIARARRAVERAAAGGRGARVEGSPATADELVDFLGGRVARWWLPERWAFVEEMPKTSVGKFDKKVLRAQHADGRPRGRRGRPARRPSLSTVSDDTDATSAERLGGHRRGAGRPGPRPAAAGRRRRCGPAASPTRRWWPRRSGSPGPAGGGQGGRAAGRPAGRHRLDDGP